MKWYILFCGLSAVSLASCGASASTEQARAIAAIEKHGGRIRYEENDPSKPVVELILDRVDKTSDCLLQTKHCRTIQSVQISQTKLAEGDLAILKDLPHLTTLMLYDVPLSNEELKHIKPLKSLRVLTVGHTGVSDPGLVHIEAITALEELYIFEPKVRDAGLERLKALTRLHRLVLAETGVGDKGLEAMKKMTKLRELVLAQTQVTDKGLEQNAMKLPPTLRQFHSCGGRAARLG
jgi:hypothetical protein